MVVKPWDLYFLNDDFIHIPLSAKTIWVHFFFFRPVANLVTATEVKLFGNHAAGFHMTSLLLHMAVTALVALLSNALLKKYGNPEKFPHAGFLTGCLFFIYPFHSEPLMWVIGRISMIATLFYIISILFFLKGSNWYHRALSLLFFIPALFTYEISWTLPLVITLLAVTDHYTHKKSWRSTIGLMLPHWLVFGVFLGLRSALLQRVFTEYDVAGRNLNIVELAANFFRLFARTVVPPAQSTMLFMGSFLIAASLLLILVIYLIKKKGLSPIHILLAAMLCISYLPVITIGTDTHGVEGERYLYLPSVFWLILLVMMISSLPLRFKTLILAAVAITYGYILFISAKAYQHASHIARNIISSVNPSTPVRNIVAINLPTNYKGAMIYRIGYQEAVRWMRPDIRFDSALVIPAERTYAPIPDSLQVLSLSDKPLEGLAVRNEPAGDKIMIAYNGQIVLYAPAYDVLLYFPPGKPGVIIYPPKHDN
jgi:hypothetical protein